MRFLSLLLLAAVSACTPVTVSPARLADTRISGLHLSSEGLWFEYDVRQCTSWGHLEVRQDGVPLELRFKGGRETRVTGQLPVVPLLVSTTEECVMPVWQPHVVEAGDPLVTRFEFDDGETVLVMEVENLAGTHSLLLTAPTTPHIRSAQRLEFQWLPANEELTAVNGSYIRVGTSNWGFDGFEFHGAAFSATVVPPFAPEFGEGTLTFEVEGRRAIRRCDGAPACEARFLESVDLAGLVVER